MKFKVFNKEKISYYLKLYIKFIINILFFCIIFSKLDEYYKRIKLFTVFEAGKLKKVVKL